MERIEYGYGFCLCFLTGYGRMVDFSRIICVILDIIMYNIETNNLT